MCYVCTKFDPLRAKYEEDEINDKWGFLQAEDVQDTVLKWKTAKKCWKVFCQKTIYPMIIMIIFYIFSHI